MRAVALVDGEHYPDVVREALASLPYEWVGAIVVGGTEKLREEPDYGVPVVTGFEGAEVVVDLSDEPVLGPAERLRWVSRALADGLPYVGADFRFDPPRLEPFELPSVSVIGTGKRVGKTAVTGHLARLLARDRSVVVVAMGRGGPPEPEVVDVAADDRRARRALPRGAARRVRPPRDGGDLRRHDDRVPSRRRRARRSRVSVERRGRGAACRRSTP